MDRFEAIASIVAKCTMYIMQANQANGCVPDFEIKKASELFYLEQSTVRVIRDTVQEKFPIK